MFFASQMFTHELYILQTLHMHNDDLASGTTVGSCRGCLWHLCHFCFQIRKWLLLQVPLGGTFKDPGCFAQSAAVGKSSPVTATASLSGTAAFQVNRAVRMSASPLTILPG